MPKGSKRISKLARSLKQLGEIQVNDWDFEGLMNKDVGDIEFAKSLRKLGSIQVMEWDFRSVMPAVTKLANQEVDIVNLVKKVADYKVMEWDFGGGHSAEMKRLRENRDASPQARLSPREMQSLMVRLKGFLQFTAASLIDGPNHARVKVREIAPNVLRFKLVLLKSDVPKLIGTGGHTAAAVRNLIKSAAGKSGVAVLLEILSHEEDAAVDDDSCSGS